MKEDKVNIPLKILIILAVIFMLIAIAIPTVITLRRFDKYDKYATKTKDIVKITKQYVVENEITEPMHITVNKLVTLGYLKADNDLGEVLNPKSEGSTLNCNTIFIDFLNTETEITFNEEKDCDLMQAELIDTTIVAYDGDIVIESDSLIENDVIIQIVGQTKCNKVTWFIDGIEIAEYRNAINIPVTYNEHVKETYSARCETDNGIKILKFILRTERAEENQH